MSGSQTYCMLLTWHHFSLNHFSKVHFYPRVVISKQNRDITVMILSIKALFCTVLFSDSININTHEHDTEFTEVSLHMSTEAACND